MKFLFLFFICAVRAGAMDTNKVVEDIIGEAAGRPFVEKVAVARAILNRGTLDGVRGFHNQGMIQRQPAWVWRDARLALAEARTNDAVFGATFWESTNFPRPSWSLGMTETARIGKFIFYKSK